MILLELVLRTGTGRLTAIFLLYVRSIVQTKTLTIFSLEYSAGIGLGVRPRTIELSLREREERALRYLWYSTTWYAT